MDRPGQFFGQRMIDQPVAGNTALARKRFGHDIDGEMAFPAGPCARMTGMGRAGKSVGFRLAAT